MGPNNLEHGRRGPECGGDGKVACSFAQLLCVEFECIFDVDVQIDRDSIIVSCGDGFPTREIEE
ncbi:MAG: hypothetical protein ACLFPF_07470 [Halanaerobiales bacterium]